MSRERPPKIRLTLTTAQIIQLLEEGEDAGAKWGYRAEIARRFGISRQRVTNIADSIALATRWPAMRRKKRA